MSSLTQLSDNTFDTPTKYFQEQLGKYADILELHHNRIDTFNDFWQGEIYLINSLTQLRSSYSPWVWVYARNKEHIHYLIPEDWGGFHNYEEIRKFNLAYHKIIDNFESRITEIMNQLNKCPVCGVQSLFSNICWRRKCVLPKN